LQSNILQYIAKLKIAIAITTTLARCPH